ncbi:MAG TPA: hypothetical protein VHZ74_20295 [Bryobacteraceae bacterium]|jgi:hypothetical protein|nr:hypothetical protein [Bryobacteraceae bacterium]
MTGAMEIGGLHVERSAQFPQFPKFHNEPLLEGRASIRNVRSTLDEQISNEGWVYFFIAGSIVATATAFDRLTALTGALKQLARNVKSRKCNSFEIADVTTKQFAGLVRASVSAHVRPFQAPSLREPVRSGQ